MTWRASVCLLALCGAATGQAAPAIPVHVLAILVDGQLNQKPVPRMLVRLAPATGGPAVSARTDFDGSADVQLPPGAYTLTTPAGVTLEGQPYRWHLSVTVAARPLTVTLSNDNAVTSDAASTSAPLAAPADATPNPNLVAQFQRLEPTVVTVWSDLAHGSGFIVALRGTQALILTNDHVVTRARYLAVQTDAHHKVAAILLSEDKDRDVAALAANLAGGPPVAAAALATGAEVAAAPAGAAIFTIGSPLDQQKVLTAGIIGRNEAHAFISGININHGNSGGPLFDAAGRVLGITTFGDSTTDGPGLSGIIKITEASAVLGRAEAKFETLPPLPSDPLPTVPDPPFPTDTLKQAARERHFDANLYQFSFAGYDVRVVTPPLYYWLNTRGDAEVATVRQRRSKGNQESGFDPGADLRNWMQYTGAYAPMISVEMTPRMKPTTASRIFKALTPAYASLHWRFDADFGRMELDCGERKIAPIQPIRQPEEVVNANDHPEDAAYEGIYEYEPGAIDPACGTVTLIVYGNEAGAPAKSHRLSAQLVQRVWDDFAPWRKAAGKH